MHKEKTTKKKLPKVRVSFTEIIRLLIYEHIITDQCSVIYHMAVDIKTAFCFPTKRNGYSYQGTRQRKMNITAEQK